MIRDIGFEPSKVCAQAEVHAEPECDVLVGITANIEAERIGEGVLAFTTEQAAWS